MLAPKHSLKKSSHKTKKHSSYKNYNTQSSPEKLFFKNTTHNEIIPNIQRRLYGILKYENIPSEIQNLENTETQKETISEIIHKNSCLANQLAYSAHNGKEWKNSTIDQLEKWLLSQFYCGRTLEILLSEAMIRNGYGFHFLPTKELDMHHKIDVMSRIPFHTSNGGGLQTMNFGMQVTLAKIEKPKQNQPKNNQNHIYQEKFQQIKNMVPFLENSTIQQDISKKYGRIYVPDILVYIGINGAIKEEILHPNAVLKKFWQWRKNNFQQEWLLDLFDESTQKMFEILSLRILETQKYILSEKFLTDLVKSFQKNKGFRKIYNSEKDFSEILIHNPSENTITITIEHKNKVLGKITFFLTKKIITRLFEIHENTH